MMDTLTRILDHTTGVFALALVLLVPLSLHASVPADEVDPPDDHDIVSVAQDAGFETLLAAAKAAGLVETLKSDGPLTVFAPTDEAFDALPEGTLEMLLKPENKEKLAAVLTYHVVAGKVTANEALALESAETVQGASLDLGTNGKTVTVNGATVVKPDVMASNGVIHVIDSVLLPPEMR